MSHAPPSASRIPTLSAALLAGIATASWRHHPTGLVDGMFSGNCFLDADGRPTMCYHQVGQGNAIAVALDDDLDVWQKLASNPITPPTAAGDPHHERYQSWDPHGWRDLFAHGVEGVALDEDVSCPDFFRLGDQRVLLCISHRLGCRYYLGDWRDEQFHPRSHASMSWSDRRCFACASSSIAPWSRPSPTSGRR